MKSLSQLNAFAAQNLELTDFRPAKVVFDRTLSEDKRITISSTSVTVPNGIDIVEIVNYSTANVRYVVTIKNSTINPITSSLNFGTLPSGVSVVESPTGTYTVSGIKKISDWNTIKNPVWTLPSGYASFPLFYLEARVIYFDEEADDDFNQTCDIFDPRFYPLTFAITESIVVANARKTVSARATLAVTGSILSLDQNLVRTGANLTATSTVFFETFPIKGYSASISSQATTSIATLNSRTRRTAASLPVISSFSGSLNQVVRLINRADFFVVAGRIGAGGVAYLEGNGIPYYNFDGSLLNIGGLPPGITRIKQGASVMSVTSTVTCIGEDARLMSAMVMSSGTMDSTGRRLAGLTVNASVISSQSTAPIRTASARSNLVANAGQLSLLTGPSRGEADIVSTSTMLATVTRIKPFSISASCNSSISAIARRTARLQTTMIAQSSVSGDGFINNPLTLHYIINNAQSSGGAARTVYLPLEGTVACQVDWGDGTVETFTTSGMKSRQYATIGSRTVRIYRISPTGVALEQFGALNGTGYTGPGYASSPASGVDYYGPGNLNYINGISSFGNLGLSKIPLAFENGAGATFEPAFVPTSIPSSLTDISFAVIPNNSNCVGWNTANVQLARQAFDGPTFNQPIGSWNVTALTNMESVFQSCQVFNQPLNSWNVSNVTNMRAMFSGANAFNQSLNSWNVSNVTNMGAMFNTARAFNGNITSWNTANVTTMGAMFNDARAFNQAIGVWNVGKVTSFAAMFQNTRVFNQPLNAWNVSNATNMQAMFGQSLLFNQPLNSWNTAKVTDMSFMFFLAPVFDQNISSWPVPLIATKPGDFDTGTLASWITAEKPNWGV